jgi:hypothetical protein
MPHKEPAIQDTSAQDTAVQAPETPAYEPIEEGDEWLEEPAELPPRPRRRLFAPVPLALMGVLLVACGFIAGVLIEKGQTSSGTSAGAAGGLGSRFAALRRDAGGATGSSGASGPGGGAGATTGSVAYVSGETLYLTTSEGNTVKVTTSAGTTVTKTVSAAVKGIHPGETVAVVGPAGANGAISAESIRVGAGGGGFGALFGGSGSGGGSRGGGAGATGGGSSGGQVLFGNGG